MTSAASSTRSGPICAATSAGGRSRAPGLSKMGGELAQHAELLHLGDPLPHLRFGEAETLAEHRERPAVSRGKSHCTALRSSRSSASSWSSLVVVVMASWSRVPGGGRAISARHPRPGTSTRHLDPAPRPGHLSPSSGRRRRPRGSPALQGDGGGAGFAVVLPLQVQLILGAAGLAHGRHQIGGVAHVAAGGTATTTSPVTSPGLGCGAALEHGLDHRAAPAAGSRPGPLSQTTPIQPCEDLPAAVRAGRARSAPPSTPGPRVRRGVPSVARVRIADQVCRRDRPVHRPTSPASPGCRSGAGRPRRCRWPASTITSRGRTPRRCPRG